MDPKDYLRSAVLVAAFGYSAFQGQEAWLHADFVACLVFGLGGLLLPDGLGYETEGKLDVVHIFVTQQQGIALLGLAVVWYVCRKSPDANVTSSLFLSKVLGLTILMVCQIMTQILTQGQAQRWNTQHITFAMLGTGMWLLGNVYHLWQSKSFGTFSDAPNNRVNQILIFDSLLCFVSAVHALVFPEYGFKHVMLKDFKVDGIHLHLIRSCGATLFVSGLLSLKAIHFRDMLDKRAIFCHRLVMLFLLTLNFWLNQWYYNFANPQLYPLQLTLAVGPFFLLGYGYYLTLPANKQKS